MLYYDEFHLSERNSSYYGWAKKNTRPIVKSNERKRISANGLLSIDVESGEEYLWICSHAQSDDVARYMAHLSLQMQEQGVQGLEILLDRNTTHQQKMKQLFEEEKEKLNVTIQVNFSYLPAYSPKLNLVEYAIHLLRQRCLHHRPYNMTMEQIVDKIKIELKAKPLLDSEQVINIMEYMENIVS